MRLTNNQLFLLAALFLATADNAPEEDFCVPANEGEWANTYNELQQNGLLDANFGLTPYGKFRMHNASTEGVNFRKLAERNPKMAIAMLREGFNVVKSLAERNTEFSNQSYKLFEEISAELGYICAPVDLSEAPVQV